LVSDRNRRVRQLLARELEAEGYLTRVAGSEEELIRGLGEEPVPDLVILDPELFRGGRSCLNPVERSLPRVKVVIHTFAEVKAACPGHWKGYPFLEKDLADLDLLKKVVAGILADVESPSPPFRPPLRVVKGPDT
jgi:CheY-like chemotaxis protein